LPFEDLTFYKIIYSVFRVLQNRRELLIKIISPLYWSTVLW